MSRITDPSMFRHCTMQVIFAFGVFEENTDVVTHVKRWWGNNRPVLMIAADDLPEFCNLYIQLQTDFDWRYYDFQDWKKSALLIDMLGKDALGVSDDLGVSRRTRALLDPFLRFKAFGSVCINGISKGTYRNHFVQSICGKEPSIGEVLSKCSEYQSKGEEAFRKGLHQLAMDQYCAAVALIENGFSDDCERRNLLIGGHLVVCVTSAALGVARLDYGLRLCLVYVCQASCQFHDMHKWATTALDVLLRWSHAICNGSQRAKKISDLCYLSGLASLRMNSDGRALEDFDCACMVDRDHVMAKRDIEAIKRKRAAGHGNLVEDQVSAWKRSYGIYKIASGAGLHP